MANNSAFVSEALAIATALTTILFAISEYFGYKRPEGCHSLTQWVGCKCVRVVDNVVKTVSPRNSVDGPHPYRRSCDVPRVSKELPRLPEGTI